VSSEFWDLRRYELELERVRILAMRVAGLESGIERIEALDANLARVPPGRVDELVHRFNLGPDEVSFMWTVIAAGYDPETSYALERLGGGDSRGGANFALHTLLHQMDAARARKLVRSMTASHPLFKAALLVAADTSADSGSARVWRCAPRFALYLAGSDDIDNAIGSVGGFLLPPDNVIPRKDQAATIDLLEQLLRTDPVIMLEGPAGVGRRTLAAIAASSMGRPLIHIDLARRHVSQASFEALNAALTREVVLVSNAIVLIANVDDLVDPGDRASAPLRVLANTIARLEVPIVLTSSTPGMTLAIPKVPVRLRVSPPDHSQRLLLWQRSLPCESKVSVSAVALRYRVGPGAISSAAASASKFARARGSTILETEDVVAGIRATIAERMGTLATRVETSAQWEDLVLSADTLDQVRALLARVQQSSKVLDEWGFRSRIARGTGIAALFSGPPGTGKTMVAGVIAKKLDLELYQVDLSKVVSKWIGETEKQLAQVFDAAEAGHALLLFDEADALFAKRTEVKGATDRYANLEVNYLLQRVEAFDGIAILTTNMDTSIEPALKRRLASHVVFWPPDDEEREHLWKRMVVTNAPIRGDLDFETLSSEYPDMSGANIRNAVISAAFLAASEGDALEQHHLERAARLEYVSMGRVLGK
jgi:SpoVK/Ycf46/Vps4 family AAA+-type ATPase